MGSPLLEEDRHSDESPQVVRITRPFWIGVYPVTQAEYRTVTDDLPSTFNEHYFDCGAGDPEDENLSTTQFPVEGVCWRDAHEFCVQLSARSEEQDIGRR